MQKCMLIYLIYKLNILYEWNRAVKTKKINFEKNNNKYSYKMKNILE